MAALALGGYFYLRMDDEIRRYAEGFLASHYSELDVRLGGAEYSAGEGVTLQNLLLSEQMPGGETRRLVEIDELELRGRFDLDALIAGRPTIESIVVRRPRMKAVRGTNDQWNVAALFPTPEAGDKPADVTIVDAVVSITDAANPSGGHFEIEGLECTIKCEQAEIAKAAGEQPQTHIAIAGSIGDTRVETCTFSAQVDPETGQFAGEADIKRLRVDAQLLATLPGIDRATFDGSDLAGLADAKINFERESPTPAPITWKADYRVHEGRLTVQGLPRRLTGISVVGTANQDRLHVRDARAQYGETELVMAMDRYGWTAAAPFAMQARAAQLKLDEGMASAMPPHLSKVWDRFRPSGDVGATLVLRYNGQNWQPDLTVHCYDVAFEDREKCPFRVCHGQGTVRFSDLGDGTGATANVNLTASAGSTPVTFAGNLTGLSSGSQSPFSKPSPQQPSGSGPTGWFEIVGNHYTLSDKLVEALPDKASKVIRALDAKGLYSFRWRYQREPGQPQPHTETDLTFHDCQVQYDKFSYPLTHIQGQAFERNDHWQFRDLVSHHTNGEREIRAHGSCTPTADGHLLDLHFTGRHVALDDTLRQALDEESQQAWSALRPTGRVDFKADVTHQIGDAKPNVRIVATPLEGSVSVAPTFFPYRFDHLAGNAVIENGNVTLHQFRADHGPTTFSTDATWVRMPGGGWQFDLSNLQVDRLTADYDLVHAAPIGLNKLLEALDPRGGFSIHDGRLLFTRNASDSTHLRSEWNLKLGCQQNSLKVGVPLKGVSGIVHLAGRHENNASVTGGMVDLDSAFLHGVQLTKIQGPIWVDNTECRLGRGASRKLTQLQEKPNAEQQISANLYGGRLRLDANIRLDAPGRYTLATTLNDIDLRRMSSEYAGSRAEMSGTLSSQATFSGMGKSIDLLEGGGTVEIRDAEMYELPVMARMLKVLRNRVPDKTAFNGVDAQFAVAGKNIRFDTLNLLGDAVSLYGQGSATLDRQIDLKFHSTVGRNDFAVPFLRSMVGQASANLLLINVTGTVDNPQVQREALPAVNDFVEQLGESGLAKPPARFMRK